MADEQVENKEVTEEGQIKTWLSRIDRARKKREKAAADGNWERLINAAKGVLELEGKYPITVGPIHSLYAYLKAEIPLLYIRNPYIKINPKNTTSISTAKVLEAVINYIWYIKKLKREIKKCLADAVSIGHSWFKTGYVGKFATVEDVSGQTMEAVESEDFFGYRVPWKDITFDNDAIDPPYDCAWISHSIDLPIEDLQKNPKYKNTNLLKPTINKEHDSPKQQLEDMDSTVVKARIEEVWDIKKRKKFTISSGVKVYIEDPIDWPHEMKGYPFSYLRFTAPNDDPYGVSDLGVIEPQVLEEIKLRAMQLNHIKRWNRQAIVPPETDDATMDQIKRGVDGAIIKGDVTKFGVIPYGPLQADVYAIENRIKEDKNNVGGQPAIERGATQKTTSRTLGELQSIAAGAKNRRAEKIDVVEDFVEHISSNLVALIKQHATEPYYVRILGLLSDELQAAIKERASGKDPSAVTKKEGFTFTKDDIQGEFDVEPVSGSSIPIDRENKLQLIDMLLEKLPKIGVVPGGPMYGVLGRMLADELNMPEFKQAIKREAQARAQMQKQQAAQQAELKRFEISKMASETQMDAEDVARKQRAVDVDELDVLLNDDRERKELDIKAKEAKKPVKPKKKKGK